MKRILLGRLMISLLAVATSDPAAAQMVTMSEARTVAQNWVSLVIAAKSNWNHQPTATVAEVKELTGNGRLVGFVCSVQPSGYVLVSLHKALQPVRAYSVEGTLDTDLVTGMPGFLRAMMFGTLSALEQAAGPIASAKSKDLQPYLELNHQSAWQELTRAAGDYRRSLKANPLAANYATG